MTKVLLHVRLNKSEVYFIIPSVTTKEKKKCITTKHIFNNKNSFGGFLFLTQKRNKEGYSLETKPGKLIS